MRVFHPVQTTGGLSPENVFLVADSANVTVAEGFLVPTYHPYLFPERPVNMFVSVNAKGPGGDMLLGALLARAYQLRQQTPFLKARVFAQVASQDAGLLAFYLDGGFQADDALDIVKLELPDAKPQAPMGYDLGPVPVQSALEQSTLLIRLNTYRLDSMQAPLLQQYITMPNFLALYISRGPEIAGEIVFTGEGDYAKLIGLYVMPNYRRLGLAKSLIAAGITTLQSRGVTNFEADVIRRSVPQCRLAQSCSATYMRTACIYPGLNYD